jgi:tRNA threonylcarbamoyladenosine biosynthesis protein TsaB
MSTLLAIETSTNACSAALLVAGKRYSRFVVAPREHSDRILGMVADLLAEAGVVRADLDAVAFGQGPGSFLGTRIAAGVAQGLGFALGIPLLPVSSLQALAQRGVEACGASAVLAAWDARMGALYWGHYELQNGVAQPVMPDALCKPEDFTLPASEFPLLLAGNAWAVYQDQFAVELPALGEAADWYPDAQYLLPEAERLFTQGQGVEAAQAAPVYLRDPV